MIEIGLKIPKLWTFLCTHTSAGQQRIMVILRRFSIFNKKKTTKAIAMMKLFIISFGPNPRIVAKFQTDRFRTFGENL